LRSAAAGIRQGPRSHAPAAVSRDSRGDPAARREGGDRARRRGQDPAVPAAGAAPGAGPVRLLLCALLALAGLVFASYCVVVIDERQLGFRTVLGVPEAEPLEPGLHLRLPWLHEVETFERRMQRFDSPRHEPQTREGELVRLDYYVLWRIV